MRIGFRNLLRQKRRNFLLGAAMSVGMAILILANSFSHGISDILFNRLLSFVSGNMSVTFSEGGNRMRQVFRDGGAMQARVRAALPELVSLEEAIGIFARAIGNSRTDNVILVGVNVKATSTEKEKKDLEENFRMIEGSFLDLTGSDRENPVLLGVDKAKSLNVELGDVLRVRFQDINGQNQAARLTVVGIFKPANVFMNAPIFLDIGDLKKMAGYGPGEIGQMYIMLPDPKKTAVQAADRLHAALQPPLAAVSGRLNRNGHSIGALVLGFRVDSSSLQELGKILPGFGTQRAVKNQDVFLGKALADSLRLRAGDRCTLNYAARQGGEEMHSNLTVTDVIPESPDFPAGAILINDRDFYGFYYRGGLRDSVVATAVPNAAHPLHPFLSREWILLDRTRTTQELQRKFKLMTRFKSEAVVVDVATMYETASMVVNLENALNLITLIAVLILFFIIQVGVVNTLRMTIVERTREIGTMRSIGMQKGDVRNLFLLETFFLSLGAGAVGVGLAYAGMWALRLMTFETGTNPMTMLLVNHRLHFVPTAFAIGAYFLLILFLAVLTAWFPARRAARLAPSDALRHFG